MRVLLFVVLCLSVLPGCLTTSRLETGTAPKEDRTIQVELAEPIEFQVVEARLQNIVEVEGTFLSGEGDSLRVAAAALTSRGGVRHPALGARIAIPRSNVVQVNEKRVSGVRTGLLIAALAGAMVAVLLTIEAGGGGPTNGGGGNPRPQ